ncbi:MAG: DUF3618 domain-containing protein [Actinomycetota bacterium]|nr:DUF3618 domain-containing protein [Actinomycetota bacterium]
MGERPDRPDEVRRDPLDAREPVPVERETRERARSGDEVTRTRAEIERTRAEMSETVDALQEKLSPQNLKEQAKVQAKETVRGAGSGFVERIKQNPVPAAMVGIGLGWLLMSGKEESSGRQRSQDGPYYYERPAGRSYPAYHEGSGRSSAGQGRSRTGEAAGQAQERASQLGSQAQDQARRARGGFQQMLQENPLAVGALAVGLGAAVGFSLPETDKENQVMGEARDSLIERGKEKAEELKPRVQSVAEEAQSAAKEEARNQNLSSQ